MSRTEPKWTVPSTPGNVLGERCGVSDSFAGKVIGSRPDGSTRPDKTAAIAAPSSCPGYQSSSTAETRSSQGINTAPPVLSTTTVRGLAAATASMSAFSSPGRSRLGRSAPSVVWSPAKTMATFERFAAATAASIWEVTSMIENFGG